MSFPLKSIYSWSLLLLMLMQFIPLNRINPPVVYDFKTPNVIKIMLKKACYDCHSNETKWTSATYIAPLSWLCWLKVSKGRNVLNFSTWDDNKTEQVKLQKAKIRKVITEGAFHQQLYDIWKTDTRLTDYESHTLTHWLSDSQKEQPSEIKNSGNNRQDKTL